MALPAAFNQLSIANIQTEFGGSNPAALSEYYKNGTYVTSGDTAPNVPTSGMIKISNFFSAAKIASSSSSHTVTEGGSGGNALGYSVMGSAFPGNISGGSLTPTTTLGGRTIKAFFMYIVKGYSTVYLIVEGDQRTTSVGNWWSYATYGDVDTPGNTAFYRANTSAPDGDYDSGNNVTRWVISQSEEPGFSGAKTDTLIIYS